MPSSVCRDQTCALRSEEHTSELQSHDNLVCRLFLEKNSLQHRGAGAAARALRAPILLRATAARGCRAPTLVRADVAGGAVYPEGFPLFFLEGPAPPAAIPLPHRAAFIG